MNDLGLQLLGLLFLFIGLGVGYMVWIKPHQAHLGWPGRGLLLLLVLTFMGGAIGSPFWWADVPQSFSWDLPPLASRMLAAAGWAFAVVTFMALQKPLYGRVRLVLWLLLVYLAPLAIVIILFHLDRFDWSAPITPFFFSLVGSMVLATLFYLRQQPAILPPAAPTPPPALVSNWLLAVAVVCGLWGLALFATDRGGSILIWVWPGDLLSSRLIGVMLLTIAAGAVYGRGEEEVARPVLALLTTYGVGVMAAALVNVWINKPAPLAYLGFFGALALVSAGLWWKKS